MNVCVFMCRPEINLQSFPILFFVFFARISHRRDLPEQGRQIRQPQGAMFLCHTRAKVYKYAPLLGLFTWGLWIEPQLSGLHNGHLAN